MKLRPLLSSSDSPRPPRRSALAVSVALCLRSPKPLGNHKKTASSAGFRCFILSHIRLATAFLSRSLSFPHYFCPKLDYSNSK